MPIVELAKKMRRMRTDDELALITTAPGSREDVPTWCERTGNELLDLAIEDGRFVFQIRRGK